MDLSEMMAIAIKVIADWRVDAIAIAVILVWAMLRYVGSVYRVPSPSRSLKSSAGRPKAAPSGSGGMAGPKPVRK